MEINLSSAIATPLRMQPAVELQMFDDAIDEVCALVRRDSFRRFCASPAAAQLAEAQPHLLVCAAEEHDGGSVRTGPLEQTLAPMPPSPPPAPLLLHRRPHTTPPSTTAAKEAELPPKAAALLGLGGNVTAAKEGHAAVKMDAAAEDLGAVAMQSAKLKVLEEQKAAFSATLEKAEAEKAAAVQAAICFAATRASEAAAAERRRSRTEKELAVVGVLGENFTSS
jgi:hypothetical protein